MARHVVGRVEEIPPGGRKIVTVAGRSIGIFNIGGEFFALRNRCPHQGGPLCEGLLWGMLQARAPGEVEYTRAGEILTCAWHGWEFDIRTGQSWCDPERLRVRRYDVHVEQGDALAPAAAPAPGKVPGPYVAETYPVVAEGQCLVIEVAS
ncbi:MAG: Rieske (2Fe-2S) protein [Chloroflexota bacterium]|nr:Rieske (2Fe-2S) protein [Chloroflexota bacterium]MDQ6905486.1 Rieske (2Fe-2S) protein [Chloroflexota bacterium]